MTGKNERDGISLAAVDVGGTFTDLVAISSGSLIALKVPSTPHFPERAVIDALRSVDGVGCELVHGSTVATNAVLERKGAVTALVATEGFSDVIEIGRQQRPSLYRLFVERETPLVPRRLRFEAPERVGPRGTVIRELTPASARRIAGEVAASGAGSAAVCLLFSFEHPEHELMLEEELSKAGLSVSISSRVLPEYREYERASTTVINAYVAPVMRSYLERLLDGLGPGSSDRVRLMHSAGGTISARSSVSRAAELVLSGPAGGVVAARRLADMLGLAEVISFDMGGTSTDVSLVGREASLTRETTVGGLPVALPMIDIHTIGAGGGSIARVDRAGVLKVGPESAGADPGPACYGKGRLPCVTDANLALGRIEPERFLGGRMRLAPDRGASSLASLAPGRSVEEIASACLSVALSHMESAVKKVSLERGHDPRDSTLVAFGGAGPMHACELASRLEIPRVIIPEYPGLFSSVGMLLADAGRDYSRSVLELLDEDALSVIVPLFARMESEAAADMSAEGFERSKLRFTRSLDMRYRGQSHEVGVTVNRLSLPGLRAHFEQAYLQAYGYLRADAEVEVVNVRLSCRSPGPGIPFRQQPGGRMRPEPLYRNKLHFDKVVEGPVYDRAAIDAGFPVDGPALVVQDDATSVVPPGWRVTVDIMGNLDCEALR